jgi:hypothetical protein
MRGVSKDKPHAPVSASFETPRKGAAPQSLTEK